MTTNTKPTFGQSTNIEIVGKATLALTMAWYSMTNLKEQQLDNSNLQQLPVDMRPVGKTTANTKGTATLQSRRDFRSLYKKIAQDKWFKSAYEGKSFGDIMPVES